MRAVSLWRPWPWTIFYGGKDVENRPWALDFRGDIVLHATKHFDADSVPFIERTLRKGSFKPPLMLPSAHAEGLIGVVEIVGCYEIDETRPPGRWEMGPFCWEIANPRAFAKPIPWKGKQGIFHVPDDVVAAALRGAA